MKPAKAILVVTTVWMLAAAAAAAQPQQPSGTARPTFKWWLDDKFKTELALRPEQSARIDEIFQASYPRLRANKETFDRLDAQLSQLLSEANVTEAEFVKQIDQVEAARSEMSKCRTLMLFRMRQVLSPEQRAKLKAMHEQWEAARRRSGDPRNR